MTRNKIYKAIDSRDVGFSDLVYDLHLQEPTRYYDKDKYKYIMMAIDSIAKKIISTKPYTCANVPDKTLVYNEGALIEGIKYEINFSNDDNLLYLHTSLAFLETDAELEARLEADAKYNAKQLESEKELYLRLKEKYGDL